MFTLRDSILIQAPIERCFQLSTSLEVVARELHMSPVANPVSSPTHGRTHGLVHAGDTIRWQGRQLGLPQFHVSLIPPETWNPPHFFRDRMIAGRFRSFQHDHAFTDTPAGVRLDDTLRFSLPLGPAGWLAGRLILVPHIRRLLRRRFRLLKHLAESSEWRTYLDHQ